VSWPVRILACSKLGLFEAGHPAVAGHGGRAGSAAGKGSFIPAPVVKAPGPTRLFGWFTGRWRRRWGKAGISCAANAESCCAIPSTARCGYAADSLWTAGDKVAGKRGDTAVAAEPNVGRGRSRRPAARTESRGRIRQAGLRAEARDVVCRLCSLLPNCFAAGSAHLQFRNHLRNSSRLQRSIEPIEGSRASCWSGADLCCATLATVSFSPRSKKKRGACHRRSRQVRSVGGRTTPLLNAASH
jgi:hypothetical protein